MALIRRTDAAPFDMFRDLDAMGRWLGLGRWGEPRERASRADWAPAADVLESEGEYRIRVALPGVPKTEATVSLREGVLTIQGSPPAAREGGAGDIVYRAEIPRGPFLRSFTVPDDADEEGVSAKLEHGVLEVTIRKAPSSVSVARDVTID